MDNKEFQTQYQYESNESKNKKIWKNIGIGALSFLVAVLTILVINI